MPNVLDATPPNTIESITTNSSPESADSIESFQIIQEDTDLLLIECMKMHIPVTAKKRGKIIDIFIKEGDLISEGDKLLEVVYDF